MIVSMKKLSIFLVVAFTMFGSAFAISDVEMNIVSKFWQLDSKSKKIMSKVADWAVEYNTDKVISSVSAQELKELVRDSVKLSVEARKLKKIVAGTNNRILMDEKFNELAESSNLGETDLLRLVVGTGVHLITYEQMAFFYELAKRDNTLKAKFNEINVFGLRNHYDRLEKNFLGVYKRKNFALSMKILGDNKDQLTRLQSGKGEYLHSILTRLDTELAKELKKDTGFFSSIINLIKKDWALTVSRHNQRTNSLMYYISKTFGNAAGALNVQKLMRSIPKDELKRVRLEELQPGDVVLEKTAGAITDKFIPGHFGHVAMYFGRPDQLQDVLLSNGKRLLDHDVVKKHLDKLEDGETIVESIRPGVTLVKLEHWTVNDVAILRPSSYPKEKLGDTLLRAIKYVGTIYDFNFDVNTREIIVCSELPYQAFEGIKFRIAKAAGRWTISPDDVAVLAGPAGQTTPNRPFELVYFNNDETVIPQKDAFKLYVDLLTAEKSRYQEVPKQKADFLVQE
ncbi:MAG: hypothetical protein KC646_07480 [Candidatus Cloacimonetes bacterium]|nr:hypothetical protein [Candidatus Cloacimonadota bacterium]